MKCNLSKAIMILILLSLCSIVLISCSGKSESLEQKDGIAASSINMTIPGKEEITFNEVGKYTVYLQTQGSSDGKYYSVSNNIQSLSIKVYNNDEMVNIQSPKGKSTMTIGTDKFEGIFQFEINKPGTYTMEGNLNSTKIQNANIKIEKSNAILYFILKIFLAVGFTIAVVLVIVGAILYRILKRKKKAV